MTLLSYPGRYSLLKGRQREYFAKGNRWKLSDIQSKNFWLSVLKCNNKTGIFFKFLASSFFIRIIRHIITIKTEYYCSLKSMELTPE